VSIDWPDVQVALDILGLEVKDCRRVTIGPQSVESEYMARNAEGRLFAREDNEVATRTTTRQIAYPMPAERFPDEPTPIHDRLSEETS